MSNATREPQGLFLQASNGKGDSRTGGQAGQEGESSDWEARDKEVVEQEARSDNEYV